MAKVTLVQVVYNGMRYIPQSFDSMMNQTFKDVDYVAVICGNNDGGKEYIQERYPAVKVIDPGENLWFAKSHNLIFNQYDSEFFQLVNQDLILEPTYVEEILKTFDDPSIGAATGKLLRYDFAKNQKTNIYDTTGVTMSRNGRARDRGQHEVDAGQYNSKTDVIAVSGAGPMYRREALESVKMPYYNTTMYYSKGAYEYFDEDFVAYWEDVDLSLRLQQAGWQCLYAPKAVGYHGRSAGSSEEGYKNIGKFIKHHQGISHTVKQLNFKNHMFVIIKNFPRLYWKFFVREFFMLGYILIFEIATLKILPTLFKQLPIMWQKRKWIRQHRKNAKWTQLLNNKGLLS